MNRFFAVPKVARALGSLLPVHQMNCNQGRLMPLVAAARAGDTQLLLAPVEPRVRARSSPPVGVTHGDPEQVGLVRVMVLVPPLRVTGVAGRCVAGSMLPPAAQLSEPVQLPRAMSLRGLAIVVIESSVFAVQLVPL